MSTFTDSMNNTPIVFSIPGIHNLCKFYTSYFFIRFRILRETPSDGPFSIRIIFHLIFTPLKSIKNIRIMHHPIFCKDHKKKLKKIISSLAAVG